MHKMWNMIKALTMFPSASRTTGMWCLLMLESMILPQHHFAQCQGASDGPDSGDTCAAHGRALPAVARHLKRTAADHWRRVWRLAVRCKTRKRNWIPDYLSDQWFIEPATWISGAFCQEFFWQNSFGTRTIYLGAGDIE
jgi:hypothetical protein